MNSFVSELFPVRRRVRQGYPLSPLLYVLIAESLGYAIHADPVFDGFPLPSGGKRHKISQYADDTSALVTSDDSIFALIRLFERYEKASGARLNITKCEAFLLGPWTSITSFPVDFRFSSSHIVALGSRLTNDVGEDRGPLLRKREKVFQSWAHRKLSFKGQALITNCLSLSTSWYVGSIRLIPTNIIHEINKLVFPFVWDKKRKWLSRSSVTQPLDRGILGVVKVTRKI